MIQKYIGDEPFYLTYGDARSDVNIQKLTEFHKSHEKCLMLTAVTLGQQKSVLDIQKGNTITAFREKASSDGAVINGGYMVCNTRIFDYLYSRAVRFANLLIIFHVTLRHSGKV